MAGRATCSRRVARWPVHSHFWRARGVTRRFFSNLQIFYGNTGRGGAKSGLDRRAEWPAFAFAGPLSDVHRPGQGKGSPEGRYRLERMPGALAVIISFELCFVLTFTYVW